MNEQRISYKGIKSGNGYLWFVTYDNHVLGDSRPYDTAEEASKAAMEAVSYDADNRYYMPGYAEK